MQKNIDEKNVRSLLRDANGVTVVDHRADEGYVTPEEVAGEDDVYISRIRKDPSVKNGIVFWCVGDNLRKGAALNTVQIAELLVSKKIKGVPSLMFKINKFQNNYYGIYLDFCRNFCCSLPNCPFCISKKYDLQIRRIWSRLY